MTIETTRFDLFSRRDLIHGGLILGGLALTGCSPSGSSDGGSEPRQILAAAQSSATPPPAAHEAAMTVYRDPSCGCCGAWADIAREAGYQVTLLDDSDMAAVKLRLGVPAGLASCHTALVDGYVVEGHVPLDQVDRLLRERPADIKGIAVPGMPIGSPGMEVPDGTREQFQVIAFDQAGETSIYRG